MTEKEWKAESRKQYFHYFRFLFLAFGLVLVAFVASLIYRGMKGEEERGNDSAPKERVYDYADVLSDEEEEDLRDLIARKEEEAHCDLVIVTTYEPVGERPYDREASLQVMADDFYDDNLFGYDKVHGDGALLMDNWYEGQMATWLSTCGSVYEKFGDRDIDEVLDAVYAYINVSPYQAYKAFVITCADKMSKPSGLWFFPVLILLGPMVAMLLFVAVKLKAPIGEDTVPIAAYVVGGRPRMRAQSDQLVNRIVTHRAIPRPESHSGGGGGGGGHVSSGGVSHGGGGRSR